jgi:hypothetical protein
VLEPRELTGALVTNHHKCSRVGAPLDSTAERSRLERGVSKKLLHLFDGHASCDESGCAGVREEMQLHLLGELCRSAVSKKEYTVSVARITKESLEEWGAVCIPFHLFRSRPFT